MKDGPPRPFAGEAFGLLQGLLAGDEAPQATIQQDT